MPAPAASIVVPTRARPDYLRVALASLAPQVAATDSELIVVDDDFATVGETRDLCGRHGAHYVAHPRPLGLNAARNTGVACSRGELVVFVDDDVRVRDGWLAALLGAARAHPDVDVFTGPIRVCLEGSPPRSCGREPPPITALDLGDGDARVRFAWGANMAIRRRALQRVGPFDVSLENGGDEQEWQERLGSPGGAMYVAAASLEHRRAPADARLRPLCRAAYVRGRAARRFDDRRGRGPSLHRELLTLAGCLGHVLRYRCPMGLTMVAHSWGRVRASASEASAGACASEASASPSAGAGAGPSVSEASASGPSAGASASNASASGAGAGPTAPVAGSHLTGSSTPFADPAPPIAGPSPSLAAPPPPPASDDFLSGESGTVGGLDGARRALLDAGADALEIASFRRLRLDRAARRSPAGTRRVLALCVERPEHAALTAALADELARSRHRVQLRRSPPGAAGKFENLNRMLAAERIEEFDWLLVLDDDVVLPRGFIDRFLFLAERFALDLAQPAHRAASHAAWRVTRRRRGAVARETRFVEIGPVTAFASSTFAALLPFPRVRMGWGLDLHWAALAAEHGWRCGVIDAVAIAHRAAPAAAAYSREQALCEARAFLRERPYLPAAEAQQTLATHRRW
jgi:GT2 family glycosyltransferase